ncbi:MAG: hypothetical protein Q9187_007685 [Circinaria calcarea]
MQKGQLPDRANPVKAKRPENINRGKPLPSPPSTSDEEGEDDEGEGEEESEDEEERDDGDGEDEDESEDEEERDGGDGEDEDKSEDEEESDDDDGEDEGKSEDEEESDEEESEDEEKKATEKGKGKATKKGKGKAIEKGKEKATEKGKKSDVKTYDGNKYDGWIYRRIQKECSDRGLPARLTRDKMVGYLLEDDRQQKVAQGPGPPRQETDGNPKNTKKSKSKNLKKHKGKGVVHPGGNGTNKGAGSGTGKAPRGGSGTGKAPAGGNGTGKAPAKGKPEKAQPKAKNGVTLETISKELFNTIDAAVEQLKKVDETQDTETRPGRGARWREIVFLGDPVKTSSWPEYPTMKLGDFGDAIRTYPGDPYNNGLQHWAAVREHYDAPEQSAIPPIEALGMNAPAEANPDECEYIRPEETLTDDRFLQAPLSAYSNVFSLGSTMHRATTLASLSSSFQSGSLRSPYLARAPYSRRLLELISRCVREDPHARPTPEQLYRITGSCLAACRDYQAKLGGKNPFRVFYRGVEINQMETGFWQPEYINNGIPVYEDLQFPVKVDGVGIDPPTVEEFYPYQSKNRDFFTRADNTYRNSGSSKAKLKPKKDKIDLVPHAYNRQLWPIVYGPSAVFSKRVFEANVEKYGHGEKEGNDDDDDDDAINSDGDKSNDDDERDSGNKNSMDNGKGGSDEKNSGNGKNEDGQNGEDGEEDNAEEGNGGKNGGVGIWNIFGFLAPFD